MSSYKKWAKSGIKFQLAANPKDIYHLVPMADHDETYYLMNGNIKISTATFTYKHLHLTIHHRGLRFTKEIALSELTFMP